MPLKLSDNFFGQGAEESPSKKYRSTGGLPVRKVPRIVRHWNIIQDDIRFCTAPTAV
jgi:hypothetical protein